MPISLPKGLYGVTLTPFNDQGALDEAAFRHQLEHCAAADIEGVVTCGSTSEFIYMQPTAAARVAELAAEVVGGRKVLVGGACAPTERLAIQAMERLAALGYGYALVCPPYYYPQKTADVLDFYRAVAAKAPAGMKMILYHIPFCTTGIALSTLPELMALDAVAGLKDSSGDMLYHGKAKRIMERARPEARLFTGQDSTLLASAAMGGSGCMSTGCWLLAGLERQMLAALGAGRSDEARQAHTRLVDIVMKLDEVPFPENYRLLSEACGIYAGRPQRQYSAMEHTRRQAFIKEVAVLLQ